jgi:hypothetical protein
MSALLLQWWPVLVALVAVVVMFADIRSQSKQTREDLKEHRRESSESAKAQGTKIDAISADVASVRTDVAVLKARDEWEAATKPSLQAVPGARK